MLVSCRLPSPPLSIFFPSGRGGNLFPDVSLFQVRRLLVPSSPFLFYEFLKTSFQHLPGHVERPCSPPCRLLFPFLLFLSGRDASLFFFLKVVKAHSFSSIEGASLARRETSSFLQLFEEKVVPSLPSMLIALFRARLECPFSLFCPASPCLTFPFPFLPPASRRRIFLHVIDLFLQDEQNTLSYPCQIEGLLVVMGNSPPFLSIAEARSTILAFFSYPLANFDREII